VFFLICPLANCPPISRFDFAKIITRVYVLGPGRVRRIPARLKRILRPLVESGEILRAGLGFIRNSPTDIGRAADLLISWLLLSKVPISERALKEIFTTVKHNWKRSAVERTRTSSAHYSKSPPDSENFSVSTVLEWCEPFVRVDHGNGLVCFTSAAIEEVAADVFSKPTERDLAISVAKTCLDYLGDITKIRCVTKAELVTTLRKHAFLEQAAQFATYLAVIGDDDYRERDEVEDMVMRFFDSPKRFLAMQVFFYMDSENECSSWDEFGRWIDSMSRLHVASRWGLLKQVMTLLDNGEENVKLEDSHGSTALHEAAKSGAASVVNALLESDIGIASAVDSKGKTPLFYAWHGDHRRALVLLFEAQCTSPTFHPSGDISGTELGDAVYKYCLAKSDLADGEDDVYCMGVAMMQAIEDDLDAIAVLLINRGADPNTVVDGKSALYTAVEKGKDTLAATLLSKHADLLEDVPEGLESILHLAVEKRLRRTVLELLDSHGIDVNRKDSKGRTALFAAMEAGDEEWATYMTTYLLSRGLNVDELDEDHRHIMHVVAEKGYMNVFSDIMFRSRLIDEPKDENGRTPFDIALKNGNDGIAKFLRPTYAFYGRFR